MTSKQDDMQHRNKAPVPRIRAIRSGQHVTSQISMQHRNQALVTRTGEASPLDSVEGARREVDDARGGARHQPHGAAAQPLEEPLHALRARALYRLREHAGHAVDDALL